MNFDHLPPECQPQAIAEEAGRILGFINSTATSRQTALMEEAARRREAREAETAQRVTERLARMGANPGQTAKAGMMLQTAAVFLPEEQRILSADPAAAAARAAAVTLGLEYFANHPEALLAELLDPEPPPPADPETGFLGYILRERVAERGEHSRLTGLPAPVALAYFGIVNARLLSRQMTPKPGGPPPGPFMEDLARSWNRTGARLSGG